jgi:hypothetical protein
MDIISHGHKGLSPQSAANPEVAGVPEEQLLVSKVLPIFRGSRYFCAYSDLTLLYEAYDYSSLPKV